MTTSTFLDAIGSRRFHLISGKGGVGKTTLACSMGVALARQGQRVLLVAMRSTDQVHRYFGKSVTGLQEVQLEPGLFAIHLDEQEVFDDYIRKTFRFKSLYNRILGSPVYQYFTAAAPGFRELIVLDVIQEFIRSHKPAFDRVIVDAPATGHGLSYFEVGHQALRTFPVGPLHQKAKRVNALLSDQETTSAILVTLAEEMPINETLELHAAFRERLGIRVDAVIVNGLFPEPSRQLPEDALQRLEEAAEFFPAPELAQSFAQSGRFYAARSRLNHFHRSRLEALGSVACIEVPFLVQKDRDREFLMEFWQHLGSPEEKLSAEPKG